MPSSVCQSSSLLERTNSCVCIYLYIGAGLLPVQFNPQIIEMVSLYVDIKEWNDIIFLRLMRESVVESYDEQYKKLFESL